MRFDLQTAELMHWAEIFYSTRKWEKWGADAARTLLFQSAERVRYRINLVPDSFFD